MIKGKRNKRSYKPRPQSEFEQRIVDLARVTRVMAGGKRLRFRACVALGDKKGKVGWSVAKGADVTIAVNKAVTKAKKDLFKIRLVNNTIPHKIEGRFKSARVMLKPAIEGTGIIAGGAVRQILELAGVPNIYGKMLGGTNNKISNIEATFNALKLLKYPKEEDNAKAPASPADAVSQGGQKEERKGAKDSKAQKDGTEVQKEEDQAQLEEVKERDLDREDDLEKEQAKLLKKDGLAEDLQIAKKSLKIK